MIKSGGGGATGGSGLKIVPSRRQIETKSPLSPGLGKSRGLI